MLCTGTDLGGGCRGCAPPWLVGSATMAGRGPTAPSRSRDLCIPFQVKGAISSVVSPAMVSTATCSESVRDGPALGSSTSIAVTARTRGSRATVLATLARRRSRTKVGVCSSTSAARPSKPKSVLNGSSPRPVVRRHGEILAEVAGALNVTVQGWV